jgi:hypothetical protein
MYKTIVWVKGTFSSNQGDFMVLEYPISILKLKFSILIIPFEILKSEIVSSLLMSHKTLFKE